MSTIDTGTSVDEIDHGGYDAENFAKEDYDRAGIGAIPPQTGVIGGYPGYPLPISRDEADTVVPSDKSWNEAIEDADDGENIWVESDAEEECDSPELSAEGVTIASDRYHDGSDGGLIYSEGTDTHGIRPDGADGLEICGVRFRGDNWPDVSNDRVPDGDAGSAAIYCRDSDDVRIHNAEFYGWRWAGILFYSGGDGSVLSNYHAHHMPRQGFGYGNALSGADDGHIEVYDSYWNLCRHSIKGGNGDMSYTVENCIQGPRTANHMCDVHSPCEDGEYAFRNISFLTDRVTDYSPRGQPAVNIRGIASKVIIENCQIEHREPREAIWLELDNDGEYRDWTDEPWASVTTIRNNTFNGETKQGVGAHPAGRDGEGWDDDTDVDMPDGDSGDSGGSNGSGSGDSDQQDPEQAYADDPDVHLVEVSGTADYRLEANGDWLKQGPSGGLGYSDERVDETTIRGTVDTSTDSWWVRSTETPHIRRLRVETTESEVDGLTLTMDGDDIRENRAVNLVIPDSGAGDDDSADEGDSSEGDSSEGDGSDGDTGDTGDSGDEDDSSGGGDGSGGGSGVVQHELILSDTSREYEQEGENEYSIRVGGPGARIVASTEPGKEGDFISADELEAVGTLAGGQDAYLFSGTIEEFESDRALGATIDGQRVDTDRITEWAPKGSVDREEVERIFNSNFKSNLGEVLVETGQDLKQDTNGESDDGDGSGGSGSDGDSGSDGSDESDGEGGSGNSNPPGDSDDDAPGAENGTDDDDSGSGGTDRDSDADLPDWADGRVSVAVDDAAESQRDYRLMTSGRVEAQSSSDEVNNEGRYGHAWSSVWPGNSDSFYYSGRVMQFRCSPSLITEGKQRSDINTDPNLSESMSGEILSDWRDSHTYLRVDGQRRNHEFFDPLPNGATSGEDMDLPYGRLGFDGDLPADLAVSEDSVDKWVDDTNELVYAVDDADPGDVLGIRGRVGLPTDKTKPALEVDTEGLTLAGFRSDGSSPALVFSRQLDGADDKDGRWGHCAIQFLAPFWSVVNLEVKGPGAFEYPYTGADSEIPPNRDGRYQMRGVESNDSGRFGAVVNAEVHGFSMVNISARTDSMTVLATDSYAPWPSGTAYGIAAGGPIDGTDADHWSIEELQTQTPFWRQVDVNRVLLDGGRHDIEQGTNGATAPSRFVIGHRAAGGGAVDSHRPGNIPWHAGAIYAVMPFDYGGPGTWLRGRSYFGWRLTKACIPWGDEPDMDDRHPGENAPLVQVNAGGYEDDNSYPDIRGEWTRRRLMERDSRSRINIDWPDPDGRVREMGFFNLELVDCEIGEGAEPSDVDDELAYYYTNFYDNISQPSSVYAEQN